MPRGNNNACPASNTQMKPRLSFVVPIALAVSRSISRWLVVLLVTTGVAVVSDTGALRGAPRATAQAVLRGGCREEAARRDRHGAVPRRADGGAGWRSALKRSSVRSHSVAG